MASELDDTVVTGNMTMLGLVQLPGISCIPISKGGTGWSGYNFPGSALLKVSSDATRIEGISPSSGYYPINTTNAVTCNTASAAESLVDSGLSTRKLYFSTSDIRSGTSLVGFRNDGNNTYTIKDVDPMYITAGNTYKVQNKSIVVGTFSNTANTVCFA